MARPSTAGWFGARGVRPPGARAATAGRGSRVAGFDALRLAALVAIVAFHAGAPGSEYTAWRLPALAIISAALAAGREAPRPAAERARKSAARLLAPWAFWCGVYGAVELASHLRLGVSIVDELGPRILLTGTSVHLWYLPFAFAMLLFVDMARRLTDRLPPASVCALATATALLTLAAVAVEGSHRDDAGTPGPQWLRTAPAVFFGLAVGTAMRREELRDRGLLAVTVVACVACAAIAAGLRDDLAARYGLAMLLVAPASTWRAQPPRWLAAAAGMAMGVYLVHMAVHRAVYAVSNRLPTPDLPPAGQAALVIALSFAAVALLSRSPLRRFV